MGRVVQTEVPENFDALLFDLDGTLYAKACLMPLLGLSCLGNLGLLAALFAARKSKAGIDFGSRDALLNAIALDASLRRPGNEPEEIRRWYEEGLYGAYVETMRRFYKPRACLWQYLVSRQTAYDHPHLGILSDYSHIDDRLHALKLDPDIFRARVSCEDEGALKPAPRPFQLAAERLAVPASRVLVVGDDQTADGEGAKAAGMHYWKLSSRRESSILVKLLNSWLA